MSRCPCTGAPADFATENGIALVGCAAHNVFERIIPRQPSEKELASLEPNRAHATRLAIHDIALLSDEEMLGMLKALAEKLGGTPRQDQWKPTAGIPSRDQYKKRFGSVKRAVELAGLTYRPSGPGGLAKPALVCTLPNGWRVAQ